MVNANTTRATSKKIKDSASSKRSEDISVANTLVPSLNASSGDPEGIMPVSKTAGAPSGSSLPSIGVVSNVNVVAGKKNTPKETAVDDTVFSLLVDTSESRRDRAPAASLQLPSTAKTGNSAASQIIEDEEEDNSPDIAVSSIMSERQQMWSRAITAQNSGHVILAEMLFKAIGRIGSNAKPDPTLEMVVLHPDIRLLFPGKAASAPASASPGGCPPALAGIRADILGYPPSKWPHILYHDRWKAEVENKRLFHIKNDGYWWESYSEVEEEGLLDDVAIEDWDAAANCLTTIKTPGKEVFSELTEEQFFPTNLELTGPSPTSSSSTGGTGTGERRPGRTSSLT
ncbi:hypothetical protein PGT21_002499 [Puccinia graminis f. sp. tritici]|uniref:Uncharacterized protein n=1 Tax=Puccinia graminis f. sp. tritici TaxID=56615 RepID=A0A5B0MAH7_PUCGR|nr:hypothetical protein PGT21_002499 [Puccinia graminis f. sp. tritici]